MKIIPNELFFINVENIINSGRNVELKVKGSSMRPTLISGKHKVVLAPFRDKCLRIGMIALFVCDKKHVLHRLVAINGETLTFQGDNLPNAKEVVKTEDIRAIVEFIITPGGAVVDCKRQRFIIKSRLFMLINKLRFAYMKLRCKIIDLMLTRNF